MKALHYTLALMMTALLISCGGKEEKKEKFQYDTKKETKKTATETAESSVPVDMSNKGIGPISELKFDSAINQDMASAGEATFKSKCVACHKPAQKFIGPSMKDIYDRRSPEWVMNIMLNPDVMLKEDPIAVALLKEYNGTVMLNQNLTEEEARNLAEYFRTIK